jgi:aconitate hydratase
VLLLSDARAQIEKGEGLLTLTDETKGFSFEAVLPLSPRQKGILLAGGLLNYTRETGE